MFRSSRNITLTLLGSAAMLGCCLFPGCTQRDDPVLDANGNVVRDANGNIVYHHHTYYHPWHSSGGYYGSGWPFYHSSYSSFSSPGRTGIGTSGSNVGATSHGGFGSTGHATAGS